MARPAFAAFESQRQRQRLGGVPTVPMPRKWGVHGIL